MIQIITDSVAETGADIPRELTERYQIRTVPMHVSFGAVTKDDGAFPAEEICRYYDETGKLPKTSCSTPEDFTRVFNAIHAEAPQAAAAAEELSRRCRMCFIPTNWNTCGQEAG